MGRIFKPVSVQANGNQRLIVAFVDSGSDDSIISANLAREIGAELYGEYLAFSASNDQITGKRTTLGFTIDGFALEFEVGVTNTPFHSEYSDEEGVHMIIGLDILQEIEARLVFRRSMPN
jgi:hypothetical protein